MRAYEEYSSTQEICFPMIPAHWNMWKVKHLFAERIEKGFPEEQLLVASQNHGVIPKREYETRTVEATKDLHLLKLVKQGDFVISLRSFQGGIEYAHCQGIISPAYTIMIPQEEISPAYFRLLAKSFPFIEMLKQCVTGIREGQNIDYNKLKNRHIPLPPREEQDAIVLFLDAKCAKIDMLINLKERQIELLNEKKQNIINQAVTKGLDPQAPMKDSGVDYIGVIPASWTVVPIHSVASVGNGSTPLRANTSFWHNGIFPWLNSGSVGDEIITQSEEFVTPLALSKCHLPIVKKDSLVMALTGQGKTRGKVAILEIEATINQHLAYITPNGKSVEIRFLKYVLDSMYGYIRLISDGNGSTKGGLTCFQIKHLKIALPSLKEQRDIVSQLDRINENIKNQINQAQRFIRLINEFKASLISDVVTGKSKSNFSKTEAVCFRNKIYQ